MSYFCKDDDWINVLTKHMSYSWTMILHIKEILRHLADRPSFIERLTEALLRLIHDPVILAVATLVMLAGPLGALVWLIGRLPDNRELVFCLLWGFVMACFFNVVIWFWNKYFFKEGLTKSSLSLGSEN